MRRATDALTWYIRGQSSLSRLIVLRSVPPTLASGSRRPIVL
jgi:hypothetical protein